MSTKDSQVAIREATTEDVPTIVRMGHVFSTSTPYARFMAAKDTLVAAMAVALVEGDDAQLWVAEGPKGVVGMIGGKTYVHPLFGERIAAEVCWWVDPDARKGRVGIWLLMAFEHWAETMGIHWLQMSAPDDAIGAFYERRKYTKVETVFLKELRWRGKR